MSENDLVAACLHAARHRVEVLRSAECGCFHCLALFPPSAVKTWIDTGQTALCPHCGMDAVLGSESGFDVTEELLAAMSRRWFPQSKTA